MRKILILLVTIVIIAGCAKPPPPSKYGYINRLDSSVLISDPVPFGEVKDIPVEWSEGEHLNVGCNVQYKGYSGMEDYAVRLIFFNKSSDNITINPEIKIKDMNSISVPIQDYGTYINIMATTAGVEIPQSVAVNIPNVYTPPTSYYSHTGTIIGNTGQLYNYQGSTYAHRDTALDNINSINSSLTQLGAVMAASRANQARAMAIARRNYGISSLKYASANWLKKEYVIEPHSAQAGVVMAQAPGSLPLRITVIIGDESFVFNTAGQVIQNTSYQDLEKKVPPQNLWVPAMAEEQDVRRK